MTMSDATRSSAYDALTQDLTRRGVDVATVERSLRQQRIETPSWAYGNSGTRFRVFSQPGVPRTPFEKFADAAEVHRLTGVCPSVAIHIPWDRVDDFGALRDYATSMGLTVGAINPNLFQDDAYRLGSLCHPDPAVRRQATEHLLACNAIARGVGSDLISLWLADGTNYAGQDSFIERRHRLIDALREPYADLRDGQRLLVEYKFFEPAFYHTDLADWGMALTLCQKLGPRAEVLVDLGHHAQGVNVEQIVALLIDEERLGGFHFNSRKYADDDLIVGSTNPFELFLIYVELVAAGAAATDRIAYMIDQSFNVESKIEGMLLSVTNLQEALARALLVDRPALVDAQRGSDVLGAHRVLLDAFQTDVRPLTAKVRLDLGGEADPIGTFRASGYADRVATERADGTAMSWT
ncbi:MAG: L-rhamnose isomerase [uncultured Thermomicrobiales bacterium]|uniref:L-rhamnose isomerase n=1 Tax=uncultured Thermomicrobiales bacterium TaxID=1645740 RepID=A0A6J4VF25_9BACT|nr:MAG: L-rhamnose isomerase [uncultured Thermomicrobiales bacterium]